MHFLLFSRHLFAALGAKLFVVRGWARKLKNRDRRAKCGRGEIIYHAEGKGYSVEGHSWVNNFRLVRRNVMDNVLLFRCLWVRTTILFIIFSDGRKISALRGM